jgi:hypothetical protein
MSSRQKPITIKDSASLEGPARAVSPRDELYHVK